LEAAAEAALAAPLAAEAALEAPLAAPFAARLTEALAARLAMLPLRDRRRDERFRVTRRPGIYIYIKQKNIY